MEFLTINLKQLDVMNHCESVHEHPFTQVAMHIEGNHPKCQYTYRTLVKNLYKYVLQQILTHGCKQAFIFETT